MYLPVHDCLNRRSPAIHLYELVCPQKTRLRVQSDAWHNVQEAISEEQVIMAR